MSKLPEIISSSVKWIWLFQNCRSVDISNGTGCRWIQSFLMYFPYIANYRPLCLLKVCPIRQSLKSYWLTSILPLSVEFDTCTHKNTRTNTHLRLSDLPAYIYTDGTIRDNFCFVYYDLCFNLWGERERKSDDCHNQNKKGWILNCCTFGRILYTHATRSDDENLNHTESWGGKAYTDMSKEAFCMKTKGTLSVLFQAR